MKNIFSPVEIKPTAQWVVQQIEMLILEGILETGGRLPSERELSEMLNVSRPVLRDALKLLEGRGLLEVRKSGTHVGNVTGEVFSPEIAGLIMTNVKASGDYLDFRREIEPMVASFAAERATIEDRALLTELMQRMEEANSSDIFQDDAIIDVEFHTALGECTHNIVLIHILRSCYRLLSVGVFIARRRLYALPDARQLLYAQHRAIYDAVMARDPDAARTAALAHINYISDVASEAQSEDVRRNIARLRLLQRGLPLPADED